MTYPCERCNMDEGSPVCLQDERCPSKRRAPERADLERAVSEGWLTHGWRPMHEAPEDAGALLLLVPTRWGKRSRLLQAQGDWFGSFWAIFNADEVIQRVDPVAWRPLHPWPNRKTPNV